MSQALWIFAAYLRASVRVFAIRLVRTTLHHPRFADSIEQWILDGYSMCTVEQCVRAGVDPNWVARVARKMVHS